jgi:peptide/nickel transport system permease protein
MTSIDVRNAFRASGLRAWPLSRLLTAVPWAALACLLPMFVFGLFGQWLLPHDPAAIDLSAVSQPPAWLAGGDPAYLLGTDQFGRDLLSRLIDGAHISLIVVTFGVLGAALIGVPAGLAAGYYLGWVDTVVMRLVDIKLSIPAVLLTILIGGAIGGGLRTVLISVILVFWADYARIVRSEALVLRGRGYVALAQVANCGGLRIIFKHILPNLLPTVVVMLTLQFGRALVMEAAISFIGLGIQPPASAWGLLVAEGREYLQTAWWIPTFAGSAIAVTVLGANLLGDWLQDFLDPKRRRI